MDPHQKGYTCRFVGGPWDGRDDEHARGRCGWAVLEIPEITFAYVEPTITMPHQYIRRELSLSATALERLPPGFPRRVSFMAVSTLGDEEALHRFLKPELTGVPSVLAR